MKKTTTYHHVAAKRESYNSQPEKAHQSPTMSLRQMNHPPTDHTKYSMDPYVLQRISQLEGMYDGQIQTLTNGLRERDLLIADQLKRIRELETDKIHLEKKILRMSQEQQYAKPYEQLMKDNGTLRNFIETHIKKKLKRKQSEDNIRLAYGPVDESLQKILSG